MIVKKKMQIVIPTLLVLLCSFFTSSVTAQTLPLPYVINNISEFSDEKIYVALVGKVDDTDVWIDMTTGEVNEMSVEDNTLEGPVYNGNYGPGGDAMYADVFTLLSEIPDKTINMPLISSVRVFISFESPLYLYFFGDGGGYSAPSLSNDSDPNLNLRYELVELTYGDNGLWTNTTRVDAYQYPMGLEVWGTDGFYKRVGEVLAHEDILEEWTSRVGEAFQGSLDEDLGIILNPSKSTSFQDGESYSDYFSDYVDAVWARYTDESMYLSIGDAGVWTGIVVDDQFIFTNESDGTIGMISAKPDTLEILEASGVLAEDVESTGDVDADLNIQKHFSAAFNRGAIDLDAESGELLEWSDLSTYFGSTTTHNEYVAFFHSEDISFEGETYAFAYDDVFDYSSTIQSTTPETVKITIGGFVDDPYVAPESITLSETGLSLSSDETSQLEFTLLPTDVDNDAVVWESSDTAVATVVDGLVTALTTGTSTITVSSYDETVSASITVEVNDGDYSNDTTVRIQAEDYSAMSGIQTQTTTDSSGDLNVGWIDAGDYMEYSLTIDTAGDYTIAYRISSIDAEGAVEVQVDGETVLTTTFESTGSWDSWTTQLDTLTLPAGDITLRLLATDDNWNINWIDLTLDETTSSSESSFDEQGYARIQAEDYSAMSGIQTETTIDSDGDLNVGWIDSGDYMEYQITVATAGTYTIEYRIASIDDSAVNVQVDGVTETSSTLQSTGGWANWETQSDSITLPVGDVTLRLTATDDDWNLNWIDLTLS